MSVKVTISVSELLNNPEVLEAISSAPKISDAEIYSNVLFAGIQYNTPLADITTNTPTLFDVVLDYKVKVIRDFDFTKISLLADDFKAQQKKSAKELLKIKELLEPIFVVLNKQNKVKISQSVLPAKARQNLNFVDLLVGDIDFEQKRRAKIDKISLSALEPETILDKDFRRLIRTKIRVATKQKKGVLDSFSLRDAPLSAKGFINKNFAQTSDILRTFQKTELPTQTAQLLSDIFETKVFSRPKLANFANTKDFIIRPAKNNISFDFISTQQDVKVLRTRRRKFRNLVNFFVSEPRLDLNKNILNTLNTFIFTKPAKSSIQLNKLQIEDQGVLTLQKRKITSAFNVNIHKVQKKPKKGISNKAQLIIQQVLVPKSFSRKDSIALFQEITKKTKATGKNTVFLTQENNRFLSNKNLLDVINTKNLVFTPKRALTKNTVNYLNFLSRKLSTQAPSKTINFLDIFTFFPKKGLSNKINLKQTILRPKHSSFKEFTHLKDESIKPVFGFKLDPNIADSNDKLRFSFVKKSLETDFTLKEKSIQAKSFLATSVVKDGKDILKFKVFKPASSNFSIGFEILKFKKKIRLPTLFDNATTSQFILTPKNRILLNNFKIIDNEIKLTTEPSIQNTIKEPKSTARKFIKQEASSLLAKSKSNLVQSSKSSLSKDNLNFKVNTVISSKFLEAKKETVESSFFTKKLVFRGPTRQLVKGFEQIFPRKGVIQFNTATATSELGPRHIVKGVLKTLDTSDKLRKAHARTKYFDNFSSFETLVHRGKANILKNNFSISEKRDRINTIKRLITILNLESFYSQNTNRKVEEKADAPDNGSAFYTNQGYVSGPYFLEPYVGGATTASHF